jgi:hypothetical protein
MITRLRRRFFTAAVLATVLAAIVAIVAAADTIDPGATGARYAWGENVGWINAKAPGSGGNGVTVSGRSLTGYMWGENIGWINMNCTNNGTCGSTGNYGVTNDINNPGKLSGYAWGENVGWISFSCQNVPATCASTGDYGVTIDPATGLFSGKAWGENVGWIVFDYTTSAANRVKTDDGDAIAYPTDNCPFDYNPAQTNTDGNNTALNRPGQDNLGDACDDDISGDGYGNVKKTALGKNLLVYCPIMRADVDGDGAVSILDLAKVAVYFTQSVPPAPARYSQDADSKISILDLTKMAQVFTQHVTACP